MYSHGPLAPSKGGRHPSSSLHSSNYQIVKNDFFINENENKVKLSTKYNIKKIKIINYHQNKIDRFQNDCTFSIFKTCHG